MILNSILEDIGGWKPKKQSEAAYIQLCLLKEICGYALQGENTIYIRLDEFKDYLLLVVGDHAYTRHYLHKEFALEVIQKFVAHYKFILTEEKEYYVLSW